MCIVLDSNSDEWNNYLFNITENLQDIYYTSDYYKLYEQNGDGKAKLFVYKEGSNIAIYPFMLNEIDEYDLDEKYYDIESAYGYGGPLTNNYDEIFLNSFENEFLKYCSENKIIAEFIRFHPLIKNEKIFNKNIKIIHNRSTVYLDLTKGVDRIWSEDIKSKNRNMIRKAEKSGLEVEVCNDYETFRNIYSKTMNKVEANDYYYFDEKYYEQMNTSDNYVLLNIKKTDVIIASAIFMKYGEYFHYHLAGSLKEYLKFAPNNLLLWEAIKVGCKSGAKWFHFGGGLSDSLEDNLFKFKSSFSKCTADFYIGKRVHNREIYEHLIIEWEKKNNRKAEILLQYKV
ncbi:peptidoglycan bridge formation glycyltransferase FemA/FemB family protein [Clostridium chromiireducens]|uniref:Peptidoglycan bridge formation glycyltransferase FemA/FemB family protein n=1 Tax=Clostridium chromiireducens TaxID=225345 RepID=A0A964RIJ2_9CLOT|nr:peptidoglycan bridge formation glycyltransferase FemA/FemB family protein [Clostridium chromiireducens]